MTYKKVLKLVFAVGVSSSLFVISACREDSADLVEKNRKTFEREKSQLLRAVQNELDAKEQARQRLEKSLGDLQKELKKEKSAQKQPASLRNPTWDELKDFLRDDKTNEKTYDLDTYDCKGFSIELRDHARDFGLRSAYVSIEYVGLNVAHAINAFETTDQWRIYVEPQHDSITYLEKNKADVFIPMDAVKDEFYQCQTPWDLRQALQKTKYVGSLFNYAYYENYEDRMNCWWESHELHNAEIKEYNIEVGNYNKFKTTSVDRLNRRLKHLNAWGDNLKSFAKDLGRYTSDGSFLVPPTSDRKIVNIQHYWN